MKPDEVTKFVNEDEEKRKSKMWLIGFSLMLLGTLLIISSFYILTEWWRAHMALAIVTIFLLFAGLFTVKTNVDSK